MLDGLQELRKWDKSSNPSSSLEQDSNSGNGDERELYRHCKGWDNKVIYLRSS